MAFANSLANGQEMSFCYIMTQKFAALSRRVQQGEQIMRHQTSKKLFSYWNNLRQNRVAPDRREIEPSDIRDILGDTFILEVDQRFRTISFRLAGTRLCNAYGRELKGVGFLGLWDEVDNLGIYNAVKRVYEHSKPCTVSCIAESEGRKFVEYEVMLLPLQNGSSDTVRILGTAVSTETPNWLGSDPLINNRIKSVRNIEITDVIDTPSIAPNLPGIILPIKEQHDDPQSRKVGHLTVIDGGITD